MVGDNKKSDIEFQMELLKIQLDIEHRRNWFFAIFGILLSVIIAYPTDFLGLIRWGIPPILTGLTMLFTVSLSSWEEKKLSALKKKYLG